MKLVSFDLQGTLSDHGFSDELWLKVLPEEMARSRAIPFEEAQRMLHEGSRKFGEYDWRYYSLSYWLGSDAAETQFDRLAARVNTPPRLFPELIQFVRELRRHSSVIVLSAAGRDCVDYELGDSRFLFDAIYSASDDLGAAGKPPALFIEIAKRFGLRPADCLHVGDHREMDVLNPREAGWNSFYLDCHEKREQAVSELVEMCRAALSR